MKSGKRNGIFLVAILAILGVIAIIAGTSYAFFQYKASGANVQIVKSSKLSLSLDDLTANGILLMNSEPLSDLSGLSTTAYTFTISNDGTDELSYTISLIDQDIEGTRMSDENIRYQLTVNGINRTISDLTTRDLDNGTLAVGEKRSFALKIWMKEDANGQDQVFSVKVNAFGSQRLASGVATQMLVYNANKKSSAMYVSQNKEIMAGELYPFEMAQTETTATWSDEERTEYRYLGNNPNNYVRFNGELWRIVGIFTTEDQQGNRDQRLKLVNPTSIGTYAWDSSSSTVNQGTGVNEWSTSTLARTLNSGAYFNRTLGECYLEAGQIVTPCDFSATGLSSEARNLIDSVKWYTTSMGDGSTVDFYANERKLATQTFTDGILRNASWIGTVGLLSVSDYGHTFATTDEVCYETPYQCVNRTSWLASDEMGTWLLNAATVDHGVYALTKSGTVVSVPASYRLAVHPSVYLKPSVKIAGGVGTFDNPYLLEL